MVVKIQVTEKGPPGKLADAELHFTSGPLDGLKLIGFRCGDGHGRRPERDVPGAAYSVNGERRSFSMLRPSSIQPAQERILRDVVLEAYAEHEAQTAISA